MEHGKTQIGFIGGGNMAQAMAAGLLRAGHAPEALAVAEPLATTRTRWQELHATIRTGSDNAAVAADAAVLVLAVKPQVMPAVLAGLAALARPRGQLVISVAAGVTLATLARSLGAGTPAVRVMPNQPALVGAGMAVLVASPAVDDAGREQARHVAESTGRALWLDDESLMDAVTAVSGSGPAYVFLLTECMAKAGIEAGLPPKLAAQLARATVAGAGALLVVSPEEPKKLRENVTSPGGTTEAALKVLMASDALPALMTKAIAAATKRSHELAQ